MNKAFDRILERLDEVERRLLNESGDIGCTLGITNMSEYSKSIVQQVAEEYKDGWIPCSERLPEIRQDCLVTVRYTGFMDMHGFWVKTGHMESENDWCGDCSCGEVIAWQPLPEPYKERD